MEFSELESDSEERPCRSRRLAERSRRFLRAECFRAEKNLLIFGYRQILQTFSVYITITWCEAPQPSLWSNLVLQPFIFQRFFQVLPFPSAVFIAVLRFGGAPGLMDSQLLLLSGATEAPSCSDAIGTTEAPPAPLGADIDIALLSECK